MIQDLNKGIQSNGISYNYLNLPVEIKINNSDADKINYIYDASGTKLQKTVTEGGSVTSVTDYAGNYIYKNGDIQFFNHAEGYVDVEGTDYNYVYQYKDYLDNVRLSYQDADSNGSITTDEIVEESNYYPFGLKHRGYGSATSSLGNSVAQRWKYNGVELEESLDVNLYEMELRQFAPAIARFIALDPVTHYSQSTYVAFDNNPVFWADPTGADSIYNWDTGQYVINGQVVSQQEAIEYAKNGGNADGSNVNTPKDDITVNSNGIITNVVENDKPNRFFDEDGNELFFHDSKGVDEGYVNFKYRKGERLFYNVTKEDMNNAIFESGIIFQRWMAKNNAGILNSNIGFYMWSLFSVRNKSRGGGVDFAEGYLVSLIENPGRNDAIRRANYNQDAGFFRLGNTNNIYNLYDAGNYMWGRAMRFSGFSYWEAKNGSQLNEVYFDSKADQEAIKKGYNGN